MTDIRSRVLGGETLLGAFCDLASPLSAELAGSAGYDWLILDLEHGASTEADLLGLLHAVETTPAAPLVRPQSAERLRIGRALDLGAHGVMLPQLQSAAEVRAAIPFLRYPPAGVRGVALRTRGAAMGALGHADVARVVNERILGIVQVEAPGTVAEDVAWRGRSL
jgi:2-keto-3-deoxy-L-rhamnonate aldolase RhmA